MLEHLATRLRRLLKGSEVDTARRWHASTERARNADAHAIAVSARWNADTDFASPADEHRAGAWAEIIWASCMHSLLSQPSGDCTRCLDWWRASATALPCSSQASYLSLRW